MTGRFHPHEGLVWDTWTNKPYVPPESEEQKMSPTITDIFTPLARTRLKEFAQEITDEAYELVPAMSDTSEKATFQSGQAGGLFYAAMRLRKILNLYDEEIT